MSHWSWGRGIKGFVEELKRIDYLMIRIGYYGKTKMNLTSPKF